MEPVHFFENARVVRLLVELKAQDQIELASAHTRLPSTGLPRAGRFAVAGSPASQPMTDTLQLLTVPE